MPEKQTRFCFSQAEAALAILKKRSEGCKPSAADWRRFFLSPGQRVMKRRASKMGIANGDRAIREFLLSRRALSRYKAYARALNLVSAADPDQITASIAKFLPKDVTFRAPVYLLIKHTDNSWIFHEKGTTSIGLYLAPGLKMDVLRSTLAHELTHVGQIAAGERLPKGLPAPARSAAQWAGGLAEGLAMLAAAGGPEKDPCVGLLPAHSRRWRQRNGRFSQDLRKIDNFLLAVAEGKLSGEKAGKAGMALYGNFGPWYTVGWRVGSAVGKRLGIEALVPFSRDPRTLLASYNSIAGEAGLPSFSHRLLELLRCGEGAAPGRKP